MRILQKYFVHLFLTPEYCEPFAPFEVYDTRRRNYFKSMSACPPAASYLACLTARSRIYLYSTNSCSS